MPQYVKVKIDIDLAKIGAERITDDVRLFAAKTAKDLMTDFVPMDEGILSTTVDVSVDGVHYKVPYARYQYNGINFNFNHDPNKHPLATAEWDKAMLASRGDKLTRNIQNYINRKGR